MKKILSYFMIFLLALIPFCVKAEECDSKSIKIHSIELIKKSDTVEELSEVSINNNRVDLNLKMYDVGDFAEYKIVVENKSAERMYFDASKINLNFEYMNYVASYNDNSNVIKPGSKKEVVIRITYKNEISKDKFINGKYEDQISTTLDITNENRIIDIITNPETSRNLSFIVVFIVVIGLLLWNRKKTKVLVLFLMLLLPIGVYAICNYSIDLESHIVIGSVKSNPCTYDGELVQGAEYVNGQYTYRYKQEGRRENIENDGWGVLLTDPSSTNPVITPLCTTINDKPIVSMKGMFMNSKASSIDTSSFDTSNVVNMQYMFEYAENIQDLDISNFDLSNVIDMSYMFYRSDKLENINMMGLTAPKLENLESAFSYMPKIKELDLSQLKPLSLKQLGAVTSYNLSLETLNLSNLYASETNVNNYKPFSDCPLLREVYLDNWEIDNANELGNLLRASVPVDYVSMKNWKVPSALDRFALNTGMNLIKRIDVSGWDTSSTTSLYHTFQSAYLLEEIEGLDTWDTSRVTDMSYLFESCYNLKEVDLSGFDYSKVTNVSHMFDTDGNLKKINMGSFNAESLENASLMFNQIPTLTELHFDSISTHNLKDTNYMFSKLANLKKLDLRGMDTSHVTNMNGMFSQNYSLNELDLSTFETNDSQSLDGMFSNCNSLTTAYARTQEDADRLNATSYKPDNVVFIVKP